jgi:hypothetical protein
MERIHGAFFVKIQIYNSHHHSKQIPENQVIIRNFGFQKQRLAFSKASYFLCSEYRTK